MLVVAFFLWGVNTLQSPFNGLEEFAPRHRLAPLTLCGLGPQGTPMGAASEQEFLSERDDASRR